MHIQTRFARKWPAVLLLAVIPALTNCSRIDGSVELDNGSGEPYSFEGASVEAFDFNASAALDNGSKIQKGVGRVVDANGNISLQVITATIESDALYEVEIRCPADTATDTCNVESTLHIVLDGAQLLAGGWNASALSDAAFHNTVYYAATGYSGADIRRMLDRYADALLKNASDAAADYADLLLWRTDSTANVRRPLLLGSISETLAAGAGNNDIKRLMLQWVGPYVARLDMPVTTDTYYSSPIVAANGYAYVYDSGNKFSVVDIRNPEQPVLVGPVMDALNGFKDMAISGNHLYVLGYETLYVLSLENPQRPIEVGRLDVSGADLKGLAVEGNYAYMMEVYRLSIIDVSNPATPTVVTRISRGEFAISAAGTTVAVSDYGGFHLIDMSAPAQPRIRGNLPFGVPDSDSGIPDNIILTEDYAYASNYGVLYIVDVRNLDAPTVVAQLDLLRIQDLTLEGTQLYLTREGTLTRIDVSDPTAPVETANTETPDIHTRIAAAGDLVYTAMFGTRFTVIDIDRASGDVVRTANLPLATTDDYLHFFGTAGDNIFLQDNHLNFSIIDTSNPATPAPIVTHPSWLLIDAAVVNDHVFSIDYNKKALSITDISDPFAPLTLENSLPLINPRIPFDTLRDIAQADDHVYVSWGFETFWGYHPACPSPAPAIERTGGLFVIDVSSPTAPALTGQLCLQEQANIVAIDGTHAYLGLKGGLLQVVDIANAAAPVQQGAVQLSFEPTFFAVNGSHLWAMQGRHGIEIIDIGNPAAPVITSRIATAGHSSAVTFDEHHAYVADGIAGVLMFNIDTPATPTLVASASTQGNAMSVSLVDGYLYAATKSSVDVFAALPASTTAAGSNR